MDYKILIFASLLLKPITKIKAKAEVEGGRFSKGFERGKWPKKMNSFQDGPF